MTPYLFGTAACKFSVRPTGATSSFQSKDGSDFLRRNLADQFAGGGASFEFMVQLRTRPDAMPIEDPTIEWREDHAPFVPMARLTGPSSEPGRGAPERFLRGPVLHPLARPGRASSLGRDQPHSPNRLRSHFDSAPSDQRRAACRADKLVVSALTDQRERHQLGERRNRLG
jgi:hypothetical protein